MESEEERRERLDALYNRPGHLPGCDLEEHRSVCRCRCGRPIAEPSPGCVWHQARAEEAQREAELEGEPVDYEPGWGGLAKLLFWYRWRWVHVAMKHTVIDNVCACGMTWE